MRTIVQLTRRSCLVLLLVSTVLTGFAYDFESDGIYYKKTGDATVSVTYGASTYNTYKDNVIIPSTVQNNGVTYTVTAIDGWAFMYCVRLTSVQLPGTLETIGANAFNSCTMLTGIDIPEGVVTIANDAFYNCSRLEGIVIPNTVTSIGEEAFYDCSQLHSVVIGRNVKTIGEDAFGAYAYSALTSVTCLATEPPVMGAQNCFDSYTYANGTLYVPNAAVTTYAETAWWSEFTNIEGRNFSTMGDVNGDGNVDILDVTTLIDSLLSGVYSGIDFTAADVDGDGELSVSDVVVIIDMVLSA